MSITIEIAVDSRSKLGEGATWDAAEARLWWVDIHGHLIHCFDPQTGANETIDFGERVSFACRRDAGGLLVTADSGIYTFDPETGARQALHQPEADLPGNRFNDATTDPAGRLWAGTMHDAGKPRKVQGQFYRLDTDLTLSRHFDTAEVTNGLAFSPDGTTMYFSDTAANVRTIFAADYDIATGTPTNIRPFFDTRDLAGRPDGGTVDADGCYWMAGVGGWQVVRITPQGTVDRIIEMPVEKPSKPMFGGPGLQTLFVTTIGSGSEADAAQPHAGSLFAISGLGTCGLPQARFGG